jgi:Tfp pilus assembly protein PilF
MKLYDNKYISFITVFLFAVHPIHVEPVAWISGRTFLLITLFCLLSFYFFISFSRNISEHKYFFLSLIFFIAAILTHPSGGVFPLILILYIYCFSSQLRTSSIFNKIIYILPFFLAIFVLEVLLIFFLHAQSIRINLIKKFSFFNNIILSVNAFIEYYRLIFWPFKLSIVYPNEHIIPVNLLSFFFSIAFWIIIMLTFYIVSIKNKELFFPLGWFIIFYLPVSHLFFSINYFVADRYIYLPSLGIFLFLSLLINRFIKVKIRVIKFILIVCLIFVITVLSYLSWERTRVWKDDFTLWNDALKNYDAPMAYYNRGYFYFKTGKYNEAISDFNNAIRLETDDLRAYQNRGNSFYLKGDLLKAMDDYEYIIKKDPNFIKAYIGKGNIYLDRGDYEKAMKEYDKALKIDQNNLESYNGLGIIYSELKEYDKAINAFKKVLSIDPNNIQANHNLSLIYSKKKIINKPGEYK